MKYLFVLFASFLFANTQTLFAQEQVTDDELKKYAVTMDSINDMKESLLEEIGEMVKANEGLTNARYNELSKIMNDEAKLAAAKATEEEIAFMKKVAEKKNEGTAAISQTLQKMAKEYVGATSYNKVKKALATDTELKTKYQSMLDELDKGEVN